MDLLLKSLNQSELSTLIGKTELTDESSKEIFDKACKDRNHLLIRSLIDSKKIAKTDSSNILAVCKDLECLKTLLELQDVDINHQNASGETALHLSDNPDCVRLLVLKKEIKINSIDRHGFTPLHNACYKLKYLSSEQSNLQIISYLLEKGADPNMITNSGYSPLHILCEKDLDKWSYRNSAFYNERRFHAIKLLFKYGSKTHDKSDKSNSGNLLSPLFMVTLNYEGFYHSESFKIIQYLILKGSDVQPTKKNSLLHISVKHDQDLFRLFIDPKLNLDLNLLHNGFTPLHIACINNDEDMINILLEKGADYFILNDDNKLAVELITDYSIKENVIQTIREQHQHKIDLITRLEEQMKELTERSDRVDESIQNIENEMTMMEDEVKKLKK